jgi:Lon protease-like protein
MSELLPLFPLPNVVLFPGVSLPLHIFEPRYREMAAHALDGDRLIGMVLLRPGWKGAYDDRPPIYPVGCSGLITHAEQLADGRYNIVLRGIDRFRVVEEDHEQSYRRAVIDLRPEGQPSPDDLERLQRCRGKLETLLAPALDRGGVRSAGSGATEATSAYARAASSLSDTDLVNALAQYLNLEPLEKLALLEHDRIAERAAALVDLLEMKIITARTPAVSNAFH